MRYGLIAQLVEQLTLNQLVEGSSEHEQSEFADGRSLASPDSEQIEPDYDVSHICETL